MAVIGRYTARPVRRGQARPPDAAPGARRGLSQGGPATSARRAVSCSASHVLAGEWPKRRWSPVLAPAGRQIELCSDRRRRGSAGRSGPPGYASYVCPVAAAGAPPETPVRVGPATTGRRPPKRFPKTDRGPRARPWSGSHAAPHRPAPSRARRAWLGHVRTSAAQLAIAARLEPPVSDAGEAASADGSTTLWLSQHPRVRAGTDATDRPRIQS